MTEKNLVILGGGFAGSYIAKKLEKKFKTTMIDNKDYFEYTPGVLRTLVQPSKIGTLQVLHNNYLKHTNVINANVSNVDENYVYAGNKKYKFDYLVIATGSSYNKPIKQQNIISSTRASTLKDSHEKLKKSKEILIVGGGIVGVELAGEIATKYKDKKITLIHRNIRLIPKENLKSSIYAEDFLRKNNVQIILNQKLVETNKDFCITDKGKKICPDLIFMSIGIKPNSKFMKKNFKDKLNKNDYIKVNKFLQLEGTNNIFVAGDVTNIKEEKLAQTAEAHANIIIKNLKNPNNLKTYKSKHRILVISLGKYNGILNYKKLTITGFFPSLLKNFIEYWIMKGFR